MEAYSFDSIALNLSKKLFKSSKEFQKYKLVERMFIIFPLIHSENIKDCESAIQLIKLNIEHSEQKDYKQVSKQF